MKRKKWMFVVLFLVNLVVILCFIVFTRMIRNSDKLRIDGQVTAEP